MKTLVIDDDAAVHAAIDRHIGDLCDEIRHAQLPEPGMRMAFEDPPDLVLLDLNMPRMDGFKVCRMLKESESTRDVPVLFLTVDDNVQHLARALDCGATDYIRKPFNPVELRARVQVALRAKRTFDLLREQARIDGLTGLSNRPALDDSLAAAAAAHDRGRQASALLMIDLDHFKQVNDEHGHGVGDEVLRQVADAIRASCRPYDAPCRYGGDEFAVVYGQVDAEAARRAAERLMANVRKVEVLADGVPITVRCSAGLASTDALPDGFTAGDLLKSADDALYAAKNLGRDQLVVRS